MKKLKTPAAKKSAATIPVPAAAGKSLKSAMEDRIKNLEIRN